MKSPSNFERLVLGCIDSYDSESRRIFQDFSRSTRFTFLCTAQISKFQQKSYYNFLPFFLILGSKFPEICHFSAKSSWIFAGILQNISENVDCRQYLIKFAKFCKKSGNFRNSKMDEKCHSFISSFQSYP